MLDLLNGKPRHAEAVNQAQPAQGVFGKHAGVSAAAVHVGNQPHVLIITDGVGGHFHHVRHLLDRIFGGAVVGGPVSAQFGLLLDHRLGE